MRLAIMQPYLFPYLGYFQLINCVDKFIIYDDVNYIKRGWINRNRILANGRDFLFTAPVQKVSQHKLISDTELSSEQKWRDKLIKTIDNAYRKAPFHASVFPWLRDLVLTDELSISAYNGRILKEICAYLELETELVLSSSIYENSQLKGQERILDICLQEKATEYVNPMNGRHLYDSTFFAAEDVRLLFIIPELVPYHQFGDEFVPGLSIIDYLMFLDKEEIRHKLAQYELLTKEEITERLDNG